MPRYVELQSPDDGAFDTHMTQDGHNPLGRQTSYPDRYDPGILFPIERKEARQALPLAGAPRFYGVDIWNAYELSWLQPNGCPQVATAQIRVNADSTYIIESKSLKLYLNSLNDTRFESAKALRSVMEQDLTRAAGGTVEVRLDQQPADDLVQQPLPGESLDILQPATQVYEVEPTLLQLLGSSPASTTRVWHTHLFRSLCPITDQPDWASVVVSYAGPEIDPAALLRYLISYRQHGGYHENCVERIFADIQLRCQPEQLSVSAQFLRRGGLDINPVRSSTNDPASFQASWRQ